MKQVRVSAKSARLCFHGCDPDYIRSTCRGRCCEGSGGLKVSVHPTEPLGQASGAKFLLPVDHETKGSRQRCPFKTEVNLCGLHGTPYKPFGCVASPFTINSNGTLIVRNRYKLLVCYNAGPRLPAYIAFRASLDMLFGSDESDRICSHLDRGGGDMMAQMPDRSWIILRDNDEAKRG